MIVIENGNLIRDAMESYYLDLSRMEDDISHKLIDAPKGFVKVCGKKDRKDFYWVNSGSERGNGPIYISVENGQIVKELMQKSYNLQLLKRVQCDKKAISTCLHSLQGDLDKVYSSLKDIRKSYVDPYRLDDESYKKQWEAYQYVGNPVFPEKLRHTTLRGEKVRSKSERSIADALFANKIPYRYEAPFYVSEFEAFYPDFTILDLRKRKVIYWEHLGCMDDENYVNKCVKKMNVYAKNGIVLGDNLIITMETAECPLDQPMIYKLIKTNLTGKLAL